MQTPNPIILSHLIIDVARSQTISMSGSITKYADGQGREEFSNAESALIPIAVILRYIIANTRRIKRYMKMGEEMV